MFCEFLSDIVCYMRLVRTPLRCTLRSQLQTDFVRVDRIHKNRESMYIKTAAR
jgi:hypothetical protein